MLLTSTGVRLEKVAFPTNRLVTSIADEKCKQSAYISAKNVHKSAFQEVSRKTDIGFQVMRFPWLWKLQKLFGHLPDATVSP